MDAEWVAVNVMGPDEGVQDDSAGAEIAVEATSPGQNINVADGVRVSQNNDGLDVMEGVQIVRDPGQRLSHARMDRNHSRGIALPGFWG
ncbi:hypothetical protein R1flu_028465 [Riccia fluitans]|uniref:Uncharacterized protein n=1 Tax=Riccia fluitans TaxID=41844 RepID=A0ABD1XLR3_9MARC